MRHPHFLGLRLRDGPEQLRPVAMIGDDKRQFDAALAGARSDAHPAARERSDGIGKAARPAVIDGGGRAEHHGALKLARLGAHHIAQFAEPDAEPLIEIAERAQRAMKIDRTIEARPAHQDDHALAFAEIVDAQEMAALGIGFERGA